MAPELMSDEESAQSGDRRAVDVYSFAVLLCALWTGVEPYKGLYTKQILVNVNLHDKRPSLELLADDDGAVAASDLHSSMCKLIREMWATEAVARPTVQQVSTQLHLMQESDCNRGSD